MITDHGPGFSAQHRNEDEETGHLYNRDRPHMSLDWGTLRTAADAFDRLVSVA